MFKVLPSKYMVYRDLKKMVEKNTLAYCATADLQKLQLQKVL